MGFSPFFFASKSYNAKCRILKEKETTAMASTDITVSGLSRVGAENAEYLISKIRTIPGFPKEGILFRDFMPVLADARAFGVLLDALEAALPVNPHDFDAVAGLKREVFYLVLHWPRVLAKDSSPCARPVSFRLILCRRIMILNMARLRGNRNQRRA